MVFEIFEANDDIVHTLLELIVFKYFVVQIIHIMYNCVH